MLHNYGTVYEVKVKFLPMRLIEIADPAALVDTAGAALVALEVASEVATQRTVDTLCADVLDRLDVHSPSETFRNESFQVLANYADKPDDPRARMEAERLRAFVLRRPLLDVLGPQPPIPPDRVEAVAPTFVACVRRGDKAAVQLLGDALGGPAVQAICKKFGLDLQWMHA